jgi:hypothetical protein
MGEHRTRSIEAVRTASNRFAHTSASGQRLPLVDSNAGAVQLVRRCRVADLVGQCQMKPQALAILHERDTQQPIACAERSRQVPKDLFRLCSKSYLHQETRFVRQSRLGAQRRRKHSCLTSRLAGDVEANARRKGS